MGSHHIVTDFYKDMATEFGESLANFGEAGLSHISRNCMHVDTDLEGQGVLE